MRNSNLWHRRIRESRTTHGLYKHKVYKKWREIKDRCLNSNCPRYHRYGGRGITIYDRWKTDAKHFCDYVMGLDNYGERGFTLDRINNDGHYEPGNLRWADWHTQAANTGLRSASKTGYTGVSPRGDKYGSSIRVRNKTKWFGTYKTAIEAAKARDQYIIDNKLFEYPLQILTHETAI